MCTRVIAKRDSHNQEDGINCGLRVVACGGRCLDAPCMGMQAGLDHLLRLPVSKCLELDKRDTEDVFRLPEHTT